MKKVLVLWICLFLGFISFCQERLQIGDTLPDIQILSVVGSDIQVDAWRDQVVVIEFWATWCAPCLERFRELASIQERMGDDLKVIAITDEDDSRIKVFAENTQYPFYFGSLTKELRTLFPYLSVPHAIVVAPGGTIKAITSGENLSMEVLQQVLAGADINLPLKEEVAWDPLEDLFERDSMVSNVLEIRPGERTDIPQHSRTYQDGPFKNRRLTYVNFEVTSLYREALDISAYRMIDSDELGERYCVDLVVKHSESTKIKDILLDSLQHYFGWKIDIEERENTVWVISQAPDGHNLSEADTPTYIKKANGTRYERPGGTVAQFCAYLEGYGLAGKPVIDETGLGDQLFSIDFSFLPEKTETFFDTMRRLGLEVKNEKRTISFFKLTPGI